MIRTSLLVCLVLALAMPFSAFAQPPASSQLDPKPYDPAVDPDIDMFIGHWTESMPRHLYGSLIVRDILTRCTGDPLKPTSKGAVLTEANFISHALLETGASTIPAELDGEQHVFYVMAGQGTIASAGKTYDLREGTSFITTPEFTVTMKNTGGEPLAMYMISEPLRDGFEPNGKLVVKYEFDRSQVISVHWSNIDRGLIGDGDGMSAYEGLTAVKIDPMTMAQPHSHGVGVEEVWLALKGDITLLIGKQLRNLPPGSAYKIPANGNTPHANINLTDSQIKLIHMMNSVRSETGPYGQLDGKQFDRKTEPDIGMFMSSWKESMPRNIWGSLVVRDIFTPLEGDVMKPTASGAVLTNLNEFSYATLEPGAVTTPSKLTGEQAVFYIVGGEGTVSAGGKTADLRDDIGVLMPPDLEFTIRSTGKDHLSLYMIVEPIPTGFTPNTEMKIADMTTTPFHTTTGHWCHMAKRLFKQEDGLATLIGMGPVWFDPMTMGQPHSHGEGVEEIWFSLEGDVNILLGKQLRTLPPGSAYKIPPDGMTPHSTINKSDRQIKTFWLMKVAR